VASDCSFVARQTNHGCSGLLERVVLEVSSSYNIHNNMCHQSPCKNEQPWTLPPASLLLQGVGSTGILRMWLEHKCFENFG